MAEYSSDMAPPLVKVSSVNRVGYSGEDEQSPSAVVGVGIHGGIANSGEELAVCQACDGGTLGVTGY